MKTHNGFTLIEIIVALGIMVIVGVIIVQIFSNTLRGSGRAQSLAAIKQNGQSALEVMDKNIRSARKVVCPISQTMDTIVIQGKDGSLTRYKFVTTSSSNGSIQQDHPTDYASAVLCSENTSSSESLTDTDSNTGVSISNGQFTVNRQAGFGDTVNISFKVNPGVGVAPFLGNQIDGSSFQTTIEVRSQ